MSNKCIHCGEPARLYTCGAKQCKQFRDALYVKGQLPVREWPKHETLSDLREKHVPGYCIICDEQVPKSKRTGRKRKLCLDSYCKTAYHTLYSREMRYNERAVEQAGRGSVSTTERN